MAQKPISMNKIRRIVQLLQTGTSVRTIAKQCCVSRNTVRCYKDRIASAGSLEALLLRSNEELSAIVYEPSETGKIPKEPYDTLQKLLPVYAKELQRTGVTRDLLWQEYRMLHPQGYGYTQFCHYLALHTVSKDTVMHFLHRMGEKMMVDFAGKTMSYVDENGELISCQVFVAVLPYSGYSYVEAVHSQKQEDFVRCLENALSWINGTPQCILSDNLKSFVKRSNRYEPEFTDLMEQFSIHYNTAIMAARVEKPRDKAAVEKAVHLSYQRIYAPLRDQHFRSLKELNQAIKEQLNLHHLRAFRGGNQTRKGLFEEERLHLKMLPTSRIEIKQRVSAKVQKNYHVVLGEDWHYYSVPHNYVGKQVQLIYTSSTVELYHEHERIAIHVRHIKRYGYTTDPNHMPANHRHYAIMKGWDADYFKNQAKQISPDVLEVIDRILQSRQFPEQAYNACLGILRLEKKYTSNRLTAACALSIQARSVSYKFINNILKNNTDLRLAQAPTLFSLPTDHANLRGAKEYQ